MGTFFIEFRDPLFSVIVFFSIIFMITFFSYWWSKYKRKEDSKYLDRFLEQFQTLPSTNELKLLISGGELSVKSWMLLASSYYNSGDYEKSIEIYSELIKVDKANAKELMFLLGKTYFKAGFLERSKQIFLQILKKNPRTPQALKYLLLLYEHMQDYTSAHGVLESLEAQGEDVVKERIYINVLMLLARDDLSNEDKSRYLVDIYKESHELTHLIFEYLFRIDPVAAWENLDSSKSELLSDIFWQLESKDLNLDIISKNGYLRELYSARGDVTMVSSSTIFEFDVLIKLDKKANVSLAFEYVCSNCKVSYPFVAHRCSSCHTIASLKAEYSLARGYNKDFSEENNSFQ